jgi:hypothetical protein
MPGATQFTVIPSAPNERASDRAAPINAGQHLTHLLGSDRARDRCHRPVGDDGYSGRQIHLDLAAKPGVAQERS